MTAERDIQAAILRAIGALDGVRVFRNSVGRGWMGNATALPDGRVLLDHPRRVTFGLYPGSPDLVGWRSIVITPEHVGQRLALFLGIECKRPKGGRLERTQGPFLAALEAAGAVAGVCRSEDDARRLVGAE